MFPRNSLNRHLDWTELLTCLGRPPRRQPLPAIAECPGCASVLEVYQDVAELGQWYRCRGCGFLGDGIELAMLVWDLSLDDTVERLLHSDFSFDYGESLPENLENYEVFRIKRRQKARDFWYAAKETARLQNNPGAVSLQRRFTRDLNWTAEEWAAHGGQLYGVTTKADTELCWQPGNVAYRKAGGDGSKHVAGGGKDRIFNSAGWDDVLVVPYYDLPGRHNGFLFIGREARPKTDWIYHSVLRLTQQAREDNGGTGRMEAGVAFLPVMELPAHPKFGDKLFVIDDPGLALRMHLLHIAENERPLPLLASWDGPDYRTFALWDHLPPRPLLFAGSAFTPNMILQARRTGSPLALLPPSTHKKLEAARPESILTQLEKHTVNWEAAVEHVLTTLPPIEAADFFRKLKLPDLDVIRFYQSAPPAVQKRLESLVIDSAQVRLLPLGQQKIEVTPWCWRYNKTKEIMTDAPFVIDQVTHRQNSQVTQYRGTISFRGAHYPFLAQADIFDAEPFKWVRDFLVRNGAGLPTYKNRASHHAMQLSQQIKTPDYLSVPDAIGWQANAKGFVFPDFTIQANGAILNSGSGAPATGLFPCRRFSAPRELSALELEALAQDEPQTRIFWATTVAVLVGAIAPVTRTPLFNVAITGRVTQLAGRFAAETLGCVILDPRTGRQHAGAVRDAQNLLDLHTWPVFMTRPPNETHLGMPANVLGSLPQPTFVTADPLDAALCALDSNWLVLETTEKCSRPAALPAGADAVVPAYLLDLANRRFQLDTAEPFKALRDDLTNWFERQGGKTDVIVASAELFRVQDTTNGADRIAHLLARALDSGTCFSQGEEAKYRRNQSAIMRMNDGKVHIPGVTLRRIAASRGFPHPDDRAISDAFDESQLKYAEAEVGGEFGWLVPAKWFDRQVRQFRTVSRGFPKLAQ